MQRYLLTAEVLTLAAFAVVALVKVYGGDALDTSVKPELSWFSPFAIDSTSALTAGVLLAVFIYWGWDSAVTVNEETEDPANAPGRSAVVSHGRPGAHLPGRGHGGDRLRRPRAARRPGGGPAASSAPRSSATRWTRS